MSDLKEQAEIEPQHAAAQQPNVPFSPASQNWNQMLDSP